MALLGDLRQNRGEQSELASRAIEKQILLRVKFAELDRIEGGAIRR